MFFFDVQYLLFLAPAIVLGAWAQWKVKAAYATASRLGSSSGLSGAEAAHAILRSNGIRDVHIEPTRGFLGDHYDPRSKMLRLSPDVYNGRSLAAVGIAAHEAGHAIQDSVHYAPLALRNGIVPMASIGANLSWVLLFGGLVLGSTGLIGVAIALYSAVVAFQLINLPVEYNASHRAREVLVANGIISPREVPVVGKVLNAAALTYVAATITAILTLMYFLLKAGLLGGSDE